MSRISPSDFLAKATSEIKAAGACECGSPSKSGSRISASSSSGPAPTRSGSSLKGGYPFGSQQQFLDSKRASEISHAAQNTFFDGLDQIDKSRSESQEMQRYHSAALDEVYKSIGISPNRETK